MKNDTDERNQKAKNAYTALLQVVARQPEDEEYRRFSEEVSSMSKASEPIPGDCLLGQKMTYQTSQSTVGGYHLLLFYEPT